MKLKGLVYALGGTLFLIFASWKPSPIPPVFTEEFTLEDRKLQVTAKAYTAEESRQILQTNLIGMGYIPVEVTIQNQGDHAYAISMASTAMSSARPKDVAWKYTVAGIPRAIGWKVLSYVFWPFTVPSTIDSIISYKKHRSIVKILTAKGFKEVDEVVLPYSLVKRLLYIPEKSFYDTFSVSMEDLNGDELVVVPVKVS
jgi:ketosteroid isomerase-like protein